MGWVGCLECYMVVGGVSGALHAGGWGVLSVTWGWVGCPEHYMWVGGVS